MSSFVKVLAYYSGEKGLYACVYPSPESCASLMKFCRDCGVKRSVLNPPYQWHCTVMYSDSACPPKDKVPFFDRFATYDAKVIEFRYWDGHDRDGYVVAILDCPKLHKLHAAWRAVGCKPMESEYIPHLTLMSKDNASPWIADYLNRCLKRMGPIPMVFGCHTVEDCK